MKQHLPTPWKIGAMGSGMVLIDDADGNQVTGWMSPEDGRRIVACVNACEGFETEGLETMLSINDSLIAMRDRLQVRELELYVQRDALLSAMEALVLFSKPTKTNAAALNNAHRAIAAAKGGEQ